MEAPSHTLGRFMTPLKLIEAYPGLGLTQRSLYWLLSQRHKNGLADCVVQRGARRLLIDVPKFERWLKGRQL